MKTLSFVGKDRMLNGAPCKEKQLPWHAKDRFTGRLVRAARETSKFQRMITVY